MVPANGQTTKTKINILYVVLVGKTFHLITNIYKYIHSRAIFVLEKGGGGGGGACFNWVACFASIGTYTVYCLF